MTEDGWPQGEGEDAFLLHLPDWVFSGGWPARIGVAVSGGSDSLALLHLFARIGSHRGFALHAVTVDHRLRPEAAEEARHVARLCHSLGIAHETLVWEHDAIQGNLQDQARRARYGLIGAWARGRGIGHVMLGHTADDQAETFLMGLAREAGLDGLSGMRKTWESEGVRWARPYLSIPRAELRAYLTRHGIQWVEDPSNANEAFTRVKARRALKALKPLGITVDKLSGVIANLSLAQGALQIAATERAAAIVALRAGEAAIDRAGFRLTDPEIARRITSGIIRWIARPDYAPRAEALARFREAIETGRDATLAGCRLRVTGDLAVIRREPKAVEGVEAPPDMLWDRRWRMAGPAQSGLTIRALGAEGLRQCKDWRATGHGRAALIVSPAIWQGDKLIAAPLAGFANGWTAEIDGSLASILLSH